MREKRTAQTSLFDPPAIDHPLADGLERASVWLDEHPELLDEIAADLGADTGAARGRHGLTCETILRCAVLKHLRQETCRGLEFALRDSRSAQRFARVDTARLPKKSALQAALGAVSATTWERINRHLLGVASAAGIETGNRLRIDSTVTHTHILEPADSRLLYDGIRVLSRLLGTARKRLGPQVVVFHDHRRAAKRRTLEIGSRSRRGARRSKTYRKLLRLAQRTLGYAEGALPAVASAAPPWAVSWTQKRQRNQRVAAPCRGSAATPRVRRRDGTGGGKGTEPVRAAHRHYPQGRSRHALRSQGQLRHRAQRTGARHGGGEGQSGRQRALPADA